MLLWPPTFCLPTTCLLVALATPRLFADRRACLQATVQRANFERRQGDLQTAEKLMKAAHAKAGAADLVDITKQVRQ